MCLDISSLLTSHFGPTVDQDTRDLTVSSDCDPVELPSGMPALLGSQSSSSPGGLSLTSVQTNDPDQSSGEPRSYPTEVHSGKS